MMTMDRRTGVRLSAMLSGALLLWACGGKVVIEGDGNAGGEGGEGGGTGVTTSNGSAADAAQSSAAGGTIWCQGQTSCSGLGTDNCSCLRSCSDTTLKAVCAPNEKGQIICICSYDDVFSGTCFETTNKSCNIDQGCCAKYFSGI
jgi:hypothetical protein